MAKMAKNGQAKIFLFQRIQHFTKCFTCFTLIFNSEWFAIIKIIYHHFIFINYLFKSAIICKLKNLLGSSIESSLSRESSVPQEKSGCIENEFLFAPDTSQLEEPARSSLPFGTNTEGTKVKILTKISHVPKHLQTYSFTVHCTVKLTAKTSKFHYFQSSYTFSKILNFFKTF